MQLKDKTVIITGASSGIGAAAALLFAKEGANLVLGARRKDELMSIMGQIIQSNGHAICLPGVVSTIPCNASDLLTRRDLIEKVWQHRRISDAAARDLNRPYFQCLLIDPNVYFTPETALGAAMLARVPLTFTLGFDPGTVDQKVQWP